VSVTLSGVSCPLGLTLRPPFCIYFGSKLAKKRKDAMGNTRQEMTHMVNAMDRSYADQSTLHAEDPLSLTFMDQHNFSPRCKLHIKNFTNAFEA
jgi:hypothetical protein